MSTTNHGNSTIVFGYKYPATASAFNKLAKDVIPHGIYSGGTLSQVGNQVIIAPYSAMFNSGSLTSNKISTASSINMNSDVGQGDITPSFPYIVANYTYANVIINYPDYYFKAEEDLSSSDIIFGKGVFSGATLIGFDYSVATIAPQYNSSTNTFNINCDTFIKNNKVETKQVITNLDENYILEQISTNIDIFVTPTADRTLDITAGAASVGTKLFLYHSGSGNFKETVTYATGQTLVLTRKRYAILESVPGGWLFVKESRIGQMEHGYIIPRGAVELAGQLRDKDALWHYVTEYYASLIVTEAAWQAGDCLKFADYSETQYKLPDLRGIFERNAGTNSNLKMVKGTAYSGGDPATKKLDMMFGHKHSNLQVDGRDIDWEIAAGGSGGFGLRLQEGAKDHSIDTVSIISDGNNGTPNIGPETAPVSGSKYAYIYTED